MKHLCSFGRGLAALLIAVAAGTMVLAQTPPAPAASPASAGNATGLPQAELGFIRQASQMARAEVQAGRLALEKARRPALRDFAQTLVREHEQAGDELLRIARAKGVAVDADPGLLQRAQLATLRRLDYEDFDHRFVDVFGVDAHEGATELFRKEAAGGSDADLKRFAQRMLPMLERHLQTARRLQAESSARARRDGLGALASSAAGSQPSGDPAGTAPAASAPAAEARGAGRTAPSRKSSTPP